MKLIKVPTGYDFHNVHGLSSIRYFSNEEKQVFVLPTKFAIADKSAEFSIPINSRLPEIKVKTENGFLSLGVNGYCILDGGPRMPICNKYTAANLKKLSLLLRNDKELTKSFIALRRGMNESLFEVCAITGEKIPKKFLEHLEASSKQVRHSLIRHADICTTERIVNVVSEAVMGWVNTVLKASEQLALCISSCNDKYPPRDKPIEYASCDFGCLHTAFTDIVTSTWTVVETIAHEQVSYLTHCTPIGRYFPTENGRIAVEGPWVTNAAQPIPQIPTAQLKQIYEIIECLVRAEWTLTRLSDIHLDIDGIDKVPVAITICMDRKCADKLKDNLSAIGIPALLTSLVGPAVLTGLLTTSGLMAVITGLAGVLAVPVDVIVGILVLLLFLLGYHALAVAGQITAWEMFDMARNGICLNHPSLPVILAGALLPVVGIQIAMLTPLIVSPRGGN